MVHPAQKQKAEIEHLYETTITAILSFHVVPPNITNVNNKLSRSKLKQPASTNLVECQHQTMKFRSSICKLHLYVEIQIRSYKTKGVYKYSGTRAASKFTYPVSGQTKIAST